MGWLGSHVDCVVVHYAIEGEHVWLPHRMLHDHASGCLSHLQPPQVVGAQMPLKLLVVCFYYSRLVDVCF